ncbi:MAG: Rrf2 family transcriptional regulator [Bryobacteraceae bacterium]|nr:Rrf2 family transcriptional regulator [Bryobacteraceae bacterium]MDW8379345.1 Rrf2 family transcriptional regulator [Bryobacterales bacterium]
MKLSAQEEYGLRCLLHMARLGEGQSLSIPEISRAEGLSVPNVAKLMRLLRLGGFVESVRGQAGGYTLARPAEEISVGSVLDALGGRFYTPKFCDRHAGLERICTRSTDCSIRTLWSTVQEVLDSVLRRVTLRDLICNEKEMMVVLEHATSHLLPLLKEGRPENRIPEKIPPPNSCPAP